MAWQATETVTVLETFGVAFGIDTCMCAHGSLLVAKCLLTLSFSATQRSLVSPCLPWGTLSVTWLPTLPLPAFPRRWSVACSISSFTSPDFFVSLFLETRNSLYISISLWSSSSGRGVVLRITAAECDAWSRHFADGLLRQEPAPLVQGPHLHCQLWPGFTNDRETERERTKRKKKKEREKRRMNGKSHGVPKPTFAGQTLLDFLGHGAGDAHVRLPFDQVQATARVRP